MTELLTTRSGNGGSGDVLDYKNAQLGTFTARGVSTSIENGWNVEKKHGHQLKSGKWKFTFSKSFPTMGEAEQELGIGNFQYMSKNRTCFNECTFDSYEEGMTWWKFQAGIHYGEFSPFANPYMSCEDIITQTQIPDIRQS